MTSDHQGSSYARELCECEAFQKSRSWLPKYGRGRGARWNFASSPCSCPKFGYITGYMRCNDEAGE